MKRIISIFLAILTIFCLTACGKSSEGIVGKWEGYADITKLIANTMSELKGIDVDAEVIIEMDLELNDDSTFSMGINADSLEDAFYNYYEKAYEAYRDAAEEKNIVPLSYSEYMFKIEIYLDSNIKAMEEEMNLSGEYKVEGNKIVFDGGENSYLIIDGDTLSYEVENVASFVFHKK